MVRPALAVGAVAGVMSAAVAAGLGGCDLAGGSTAGPRAAAEGGVVPAGPGDGQRPGGWAGRAPRGDAAGGGSGYQAGWPPGVGGLEGLGECGAGRKPVLGVRGERLREERVVAGPESWA